MTTFCALAASDRLASEGGSSDDEGSDVNEQIRSSGCWRRCKKGPERLWRITRTNFQYLSLEWSRRKLLPVILPLVASLVLLFDVYRESIGEELVSRHFILWLDGGLILIFLTVWVLPTYSVWIDVLLMVSLLAFTVCHRSVVHDDVPFELLWTALLCQLGVRSAFVLAYGLLSSCYLCMCEVNLGIFALSYVVIVVSGACTIDHSMAAGSAEMQENKSAVARLLNASDGFCTVDPRSGVIQTASASLQRLLQTERLQGESLVDFVKESSAPKLHAMYLAAAGDALPDEKVITFNIKNSEVPELGLMPVLLKTVPYRLSKDGLEISFLAHSSTDHRGWAATSSTRAATASTGSSLDPTQKRSPSDRPPTVSIGVQTDPIESSSTGSFSRPGTTGSRSGGTAESRSGRSRSAAASSSSVPDSAHASRQRPKSPDRASDSGGSTGKRVRSKTKAVDLGRNLGVEVDSEGEPTPHLQTFSNTPTTTCMKSAKELFRHWNLPKARSRCCPWHASLEVVITLFKLQKNTACDPLWSPLSAWQCEFCQAMNRESASACQLCNKQNPLINARREFSAALEEILSNADKSVTDKTESKTNSSSS